MKLIFLVFVILPCFIESIGIEHEKIIKWWSEISVKKPLKCKINAEYLKPLPNKVRKITNGLIQIPYLKIRPCSVEDTIFVPFKFKGNSSDLCLSSGIVPVLCLFGLLCAPSSFPVFILW